MIPGACPVHVEHSGFTRLKKQSCLPQEKSQQVTHQSNLLFKPALTRGVTDRRHFPHSWRRTDVMSLANREARYVRY